MLSLMFLTWMRMEITRWRVASRMNHGSISLNSTNVVRLKQQKCKISKRWIGDNGGTGAARKAMVNGCLLLISSQLLTKSHEARVRWKPFSLFVTARSFLRFRSQDVSASSASLASCREIRWASHRNVLAPFRHATVRMQCESIEPIHATKLNIHANKIV